MRAARFAAPVAAALVLVSVSVSLAQPGDELAACRSMNDGHSQVTIRPDRWVRIGAPKFDTGEGPATLTAFAAMPHRANGLLATNGRVIKLSADAGCTWVTVFRGNNVQAPAPGYTPDVFTQLVSPTDQAVWAAGYDDVDGVPHPHVYVGADIGVDGKTPSFSQLDVGLPAYGRPVSLVVARPGLGEAYLLLDQLPDPQSGQPTSPTRHLYTTYVPDSPPEAGAVTGRSWKELTPPTGFGRIDGVARQDADTIWIWSGRKFAWARDVNTTPISWHAGTAPGRISAIDVDAIGDVSVVARAAQGEALLQPDSRGRLQPRLGVPVVPTATSFTHGSYQDVYVASGPQGTWGYDRLLHRWIDITPRGGKPDFPSLTMGQATSARIVLGLTPSALWRWDTYSGETFKEPPAPPQGVGDPDHTQLPTSTLTAPVLTPIRQVVTVTPGAVHHVPVTFRVPPAPTPLDVYFLMDTTSSMNAAILGLQRAVLSLAHQIRAQLGVNACFGVGDVKDLQATAWNTDPSGTYAYKRVLPVSPCDTGPGLPKVTAAVAQLKAGGGGDTEEAQTIGLTQAVTGAGQTYLPVAPGQSAQFRAGAFKVIVLISDAGAHQGSGYPTIADTVRTLNTEDVKVVSIAVNDHSGGADLVGAHALMDAVATGTGSLAPRSGVDCNGDGGGYYGDLGPGDPLVCEETVTTASDGNQIVNIGPAILGLLLAVRDPGTIAVRVSDPDRALRGPIRGLTSEVRDLKYETGLHFTLPLGCNAGQVGRLLPVALTPYVRSAAVGLRGDVLVRCEAAPRRLVIPPVPPLVRPPEPQPAPPLPPPAPPVAPQAAVVPPPPPPNAPGQPVSNINPNAGAAHEDAQQPQVAMAMQDNVDEAAEAPETVQMSARSGSGAGSDAQFVLGAAVLLTAAVGCQVRLRRRAAVARQGR